MEGVRDVNDLIFQMNCYKFFQKKPEREEETHSKRSAKPPTLQEVSTPQDIRKNSPTQELNDENATRINMDSRDPEMIVAFDAIPTRGGGLLRLPGKERTIFYYSISWTNYFEIVDATNFEMINAALALELFEPYIKAYRRRYRNYFVKTDSNFHLIHRGFQDPQDDALLSRIMSSVESMKGNIFTVTKKNKDSDILNADYLSRSEIIMGLKYRYDEEDYDDDDQYKDNYAFISLSSVATLCTIPKLQKYLPKKYLKQN